MSSWSPDSRWTLACGAMEWPWPCWRRRERRARDRGARKLSLHVLSTNPGAMRLYTRLGFEQEGVLRGEFLIEGRYVNDILLTKHLSGPGPGGGPAAGTGGGRTALSRPGALPQRAPRLRAPSASSASASPS